MYNPGNRGTSLTSTRSAASVTATGSGDGRKKGWTGSGNVGDVWYGIGESHKTSVMRKAYHEQQILH